MSITGNNLYSYQNIENKYNEDADNIALITNRIVGLSYDSGTDTTNIDNNVTINKILNVQGVNILTEINNNTGNITTNTNNITGISFNGNNTTSIANVLSTSFDNTSNWEPHFLMTNTSTTTDLNKILQVFVGAKSGGYSPIIQTGDIAFATNTENVVDGGTGFAFVGHIWDWRGLRISTSGGTSELYCGQFDVNAILDMKSNNIQAVSQIKFNDNTIQTTAYQGGIDDVLNHVTYQDVANACTFDTKLWCQTDLFVAGTAYGTISLVENRQKIVVNKTDILTNTNNITTNTNNITTNTNNIATNVNNIATNTNNITSIKVKTDPLTYGFDGVHTSIQSAHFIATSLAVRNGANTIHHNISHSDSFGAMFFETRSNITGNGAFSFSSFKTGDTVYSYFDINHNNVNFHGKDANNVNNLNASTVTAATVTATTQVITPQITLNNRALTTMSNIARCTISVDGSGVYYLSKNLGFRAYNNGSYVQKLGTGRITLQLADYTNITSSGYQVFGSGSWNGNHDGGDCLCVNVNQKSSINQDGFLGHEFRLSFTRTYNTGSLLDLINVNGLYGACDVIVMY